jgi:hypothetical protein
MYSTDMFNSYCDYSQNFQADMETLIQPGKRPLGRPRRRWEDNIKRDLQEVGGDCGDWMERAQDRDR